MIEFNNIVSYNNKDSKDSKEIKKEYEYEIIKVG